MPVVATPVLVRNSERARFKECRQAWSWGYRHELETVQRRTVLTFGTMVHDALAGWYVPGRERGVHPAETFKELYYSSQSEFNQWDEEGNKVPADELGIAMCEEYVDYWGDDPLIEIVQPEMPFQIDVFDHNDNYLCTLVGRFDAIGLNLRTGRYFIFEHKTAKTIEYVRINSRYGEQGLSYFWAAGWWLRHVLEAGFDLDGIGYNWLRKAMPDMRPINEQGLRLNLNGSVSKKQPLDFFKRQFIRLSERQLDTFNQRLRRELYEMALAKQRKLAIYKNPGMHCSWCQFRDVCELHEMGEDWQDVLNLEFKKWDPYSDHELHLELAR